MDMTAVLLQLISGAVGGNVAGLANKARTLGPLLNTILGALGGLGGGQLAGGALNGGTAAEVGTSAVVPHAPGEAEVAKLTVVPGLRGQGLGRRLVAASLEVVRRGGYERAVLVSNSKLREAIRLYESLGFGHRPMPAGVEYETANVWMELDLGPPASV